MSESVFGNLQKLVGLPINRLEYNKDIAKAFLLRRAREKGVRLPSNPTIEEYKYHGAHVETPRAGISENVVYVDVSSMYPSLLFAINGSPETLIGTADDLQDSAYTEDDCVWGYIDTRDVRHHKGSGWQAYANPVEYKMVYDPSQTTMRWRADPEYSKCYFVSPEIERGFLPGAVDDAIALKNQYRGQPLYASTKRITNSIGYGVTGFAGEGAEAVEQARSSSRGPLTDDLYGFDLYDWRIAESICLCGRKMIQWTRDQVLDTVRQEYPESHVKMGDTDGVGIAVAGAPTRHEALTTVQAAVSDLESGGYDRFFAEQFNVEPDNHRAGVDVESFAPRVFVPAEDGTAECETGVQKRYAQWVTIEDAEEVDEISITGLEHERSDVAPVTKSVQAEFFDAVLRMGPIQARETVAPMLRDAYNQFGENGYDLDTICKRSGIGQPLTQYGSPSRSPQKIVKGAKYADRELSGVDVSAGDTVRMVYVSALPSDLPATYTAETGEDGDPVEVISVPAIEQLPDGVSVDWTRHRQKTLVEPMEDLLGTLGWSWDGILHDHGRSTLTEYT